MTDKTHTADHLAGRLRDLSERAGERDYLTHTDFLSASELAHCAELLKSGAAGSVPWTLYGGWEEAERRMAVFLPSYLTAEDMQAADAAEGDILCCVRIRPLNARFSDHPGHRDYLGALMNIGVERDQLGDILVDGEKDEAFVFTFPHIADLICSELTSVRHTAVACEKLPPSGCTLRPRFREVSGSAASLRLDALISLVWHLSRTKAKELIDAGLVSIGGAEASAAGRDLKEGERVSVRGYGKFIFDGVSGQTRKERLYVKIRVYD